MKAERKRGRKKSFFYCKKRKEKQYNKLIINKIEMEERLNLIDTFAEFKEFKNIDRETLMRILEDIFRSVLTKKYGPEANFDVIVNVDRGDLEIQRYREIVEDGDVENEFTQIALSDAI